MKVRIVTGVRVVAAAVLVLSGGPGQAIAAESTWAVNVGGPAYRATDGTTYEAESSVKGGTPGRLETVKGSQDPFLYQTFREGAVEIARLMPNGVYDITFHFAEHAPFGGGERVFDAFVEGQPVIRNLDVMRYRDGKIESALSVTIPGVELTDGELNVGFTATVGKPVLRQGHMASDLDASHRPVSLCHVVQGRGYLAGQRDLRRMAQLR